MLPKPHRFPLRQHSNFWQKSQHYYSPTLQIDFLKEATQLQVVVVVQKKVAALAVDRNYQKRLFHQVIQENFLNSPTLSGLQVVIRLKKKMPKSEFIVQELNTFETWLQQKHS
jgi:ribonuclease P protein component